MSAIQFLRRDIAKTRFITTHMIYAPAAYVVTFAWLYSYVHDAADEGDQGLDLTSYNVCALFCCAVVPVGTDE
jgi:hypothetical protein